MLHFETLGVLFCVVATDACPVAGTVPPSFGKMKNIFDLEMDTTFLSGGQLTCPPHPAGEAFQIRLDASLLCMLVELNGHCGSLRVLAALDPALFSELLLCLLALVSHADVERPL